MAERQEVRTALLRTQSVARVSARTAGVAEADDALRAKWRRQFAEARARPGGEAALVVAVAATRGGRAVVDGDAMTVMLRCVGCHAEKPALAANFTRVAAKAAYTRVCAAGAEVMNSSAGMNRAKFLQLLLAQATTPLSDAVRESAQRQLAALHRG